MNQAQKRAVNREIGYLEDDMYRYKRSERAGLGIDSARIIAEYERQIAELKEGL
jgi:hypothetical protein